MRIPIKRKTSKLVAVPGSRTKERQDIYLYGHLTISDEYRPYFQKYKELIEIFNRAKEGCYIWERTVKQYCNNYAIPYPQGLEVWLNEK